MTPVALMTGCSDGASAARSLGSRPARMAVAAASASAGPAPGGPSAWTGEQPFAERRAFLAERRERRLAPVARLEAPDFLPLPEQFDRRNDACVRGHVGKSGPMGMVRSRTPR